MATAKKNTQQATDNSSERLNLGEPEVIRTWGEISKRDEYNIMNGGAAGKMQDLRGQHVEADCVVIYGRLNVDTGELHKYVFVRLKDGAAYRTPSKSFVETLEKVGEQFFDEELSFGVEGKTSRVEGREYLVATA